jgi:hypothetical protein
VASATDTKNLGQRIIQTVAGLPESGTEYVNTQTGRTQISGLRS